MLNFGPTFIWVIVNLLVLYFVLKKILFKRVTDFMENRTNSIKNDLENAEKSKADAAQLKQEYEGRLKAAREEADKILADARKRASGEYENILGSARQDSEKLLEKTREEIERERMQMLRDVRNQVAMLALSAASKVLEANVDSESNRVLVEKFIDEVGA